MTLAEMTGKVARARRMAAEVQNLLSVTDDSQIVTQLGIAYKNLLLAEQALRAKSDAEITEASA